MQRRQFLASLGAISIGSFIPSAQAYNSNTLVHADESTDIPESVFPKVPKRKFGDTGVELPIVGLGAAVDLREKKALLATCLQYGMSYWDTSIMYGNGNSELGIGRFFSEYPEARDEVFLVTKNDDLDDNIPNVKVIDNEFHSSLQKMGVESVDAYVGLHAIEAPEQFTEEVKEWSRQMKKQGKFKYFGFSTHTNMPRMLMEASTLDWIDFILPRYNFEMMDDEDMQKGIEACYQEGKGLIAIKTQRKLAEDLTLSGDFESKAQEEMANHFLERGFTEGQAKLKMVLEDERITSAAIGIGDIGILVQNIAAALDQTLLSSKDKEVLRNFAQNTCHLSCKGCSHICESALPDVPYISDIMRQLVYYRGHGHHQKAKDSFARRIPAHAREKLLTTDYSLAEARCPQNIPIGKYVSEAVDLLA